MCPVVLVSVKLVSVAVAPNTPWLAAIPAVTENTDLSNACDDTVPIISIVNAIIIFFILILMFY